MHAAAHCGWHLSVAIFQIKQCGWVLAMVIVVYHRFWRGCADPAIGLLVMFHLLAIESHRQPGPYHRCTTQRRTRQTVTIPRGEEQRNVLQHFSTKKYQLRTLTRTADSFSRLKWSQSLRMDSWISSAVLLLSESEICVKICNDSLLLLLVFSNKFDRMSMDGPALLVERLTVMRSFLCGRCTWCG